MLANSPQIVHSLQDVASHEYDRQLSVAVPRGTRLSQSPSPALRSAESSPAPEQSPSSTKNLSATALRTVSGAPVPLSQQVASMKAAGFSSLKVADAPGDHGTRLAVTARFSSLRAQLLQTQRFPGDAAILFCWVPNRFALGASGSSNNNVFSERDLVERCTRALPAVRPKQDLIALPDVADVRAFWNWFSAQHGLDPEKQAVWFDPAAAEAAAAEAAAEGNNTGPSAFALQEVLEQVTTMVGVLERPAQNLVLYPMYLPPQVQTMVADFRTRLATAAARSNSLILVDSKKGRDAPEEKHRDVPPSSAKKFCLLGAINDPEEHLLAPLSAAKAWLHPHVQLRNPGGSLAESVAVANSDVGTCALPVVEAGDGACTPVGPTIPGKLRARGPRGFVASSRSELRDAYMRLRDSVGAATRLVLKPSWASGGDGIIFDAQMRDVEAMHFPGCYEQHFGEMTTGSSGAPLSGTSSSDSGAPLSGAPLSSTASGAPPGASHATSLHQKSRLQALTDGSRYSVIVEEQLIPDARLLEQGIHSPCLYLLGERIIGGLADQIFEQGTGVSVGSVNLGNRVPSEIERVAGGGVERAEKKVEQRISAAGGVENGTCAHTVEAALTRGQAVWLKRECVRMARHIQQFWRLQSNWGIDFLIVRDNEREADAEDALVPIVVDLNMGRPNGNWSVRLWDSEIAKEDSRMEDSTKNSSTGISSSPRPFLYSGSFVAKKPVAEFLARLHEVYGPDLSRPRGHPEIALLVYQCIQGHAGGFAMRAAHPAVARKEVERAVEAFLSICDS